MRLYIPSFPNGNHIPPKFCFGKTDHEGGLELSNNINPAIEWADIPQDTQSLALLICDPDAPLNFTIANQEGAVIDEEADRGNFYHYVLVDIPITIHSIPEGAVSHKIVPGGKTLNTQYGIEGINDYTKWFDILGPDEMKGTYFGYDGPCPPFNDKKIHNYIFMLYALDCKTLHLSGHFNGADALKAIANHKISSARWEGAYTTYKEYWV